MRYVYGKGVVRNFQKVKTKFINYSSALVLIATSMSGAAPLFLPQNASAAPTNVVINEISSTSSPDWVELYGPANTSVADWTVQFDASNTTSKKVVLPVGTTLNASGFLEVDAASNSWLGGAGDTVKLFDATSTLQDTVSFGNEFVAGDEGLAGTPSNSSTTVSRTTDGGSAWALQAATKDATNDTIIATPKVTTNEFTTINDTANYYKGVDVGFTLNDDFGTLTSIKVELYDSAGLIGTNTAAQPMLDYYNGGGRVFTTPFVITPGHYDPNTDTYWNFSSYSWNKADQPTKVVVTATGTNGTDSATNSDFTSGGGSFADLLPPAASTITVTAANDHGWGFVDDNGNGGNGSYVTGPAGSDGNGSAQLEVTNSSQGYMLSKYGSYGGTKLSDILGLSYKTYVQTGNGTIAPSLQVDVDQDVTDSNTDYQGRLVYEPYNNGTVADGQWQTWNAANGKWWLTKPSLFPALNCGQSSPCTFAQLIAAYPNIGLNDGLGGHVALKAGSGWSSFKGNVDSLQFSTASVNDIYDFEPDTTAPSVPTNGAPNNGYETTNDFYFTWDPSTDDSGQPVTYEFQSDNNGSFNNPWDSIANGNSEQNNLTSPEIHSTGAPDGTYYWRVRAIDSSGNKSAWSSTWKMTIDTTAPNIDITYPTNGQYVNTDQNSWNLTATGSVTDSNFSYYYCWVSSASTGKEVGTRASLCGTNYNQVNGGTLGVISNLKNLPDGTYKFNVVARDKAGNVTTVSHSFTLDNTKPTVQFTAADSPTANGYYNGNFDVQWSAHDNYKLKSVNVSLFDTDSSHTNHWVTTCYSNAAETTADDSGTCAVKLPANLPDGKYYVQVGTQDAAGNWSVNAVRNITIDRTAPSVPTNGAPNGNFLNSNVFNYTWDPSTDTSPVTYEYQASNVNGDFDPATGALKNVTWNSTASGSAAQKAALAAGPSIPSEGTSDGTWYWQVRAIDAAGNASDWSSVWSFTLDSQAPAVTITGSNTTGNVITPVVTATDPAPGTSLTYSWAANDAGSTSNVTISDATALEPNFTASASGTYNFTLTVTDQAGNATQKTFSFTYTTPPPAPVSHALVASANDDQSGGTGSGTFTNINTGNPGGTPQVLGASTNVPSNTNDSNGHVLGDSTSGNHHKSNASTINAKKATAFLGLGWYWWTLIVLAILASLYSLYRKAGAKASTSK